MPFTPFHFGPHSTVALPLRKYIDIPVFIGANIIVDVEPLLVMAFNLDYPLHGYCHTFLIGGLLGLAWGVAAYPFRGLIGKAMAVQSLPYSPSRWKMAISGMLGIWLHIAFDAPLYYEMKLLYPFGWNPFVGIMEMGTVYMVCALLFIPALVMYFIMVVGRKDKVHPLGGNHDIERC